MSDLLDTCPIPRISVTTNFFSPEEDTTLALKGQMRYMPDWDAFMYLATPM